MTPRSPARGKELRRWKCPGFAGRTVREHTAEWADGLKVSRLIVYRDQISLCIEWKGRHNLLRLGARTRQWEDR